MQDEPYDDVVDADDGTGSAVGRHSLVPAIRKSLSAKLERLLQRPVVARVANAISDEDDVSDNSEGRTGDVPDVFSFLQDAARASAPAEGLRHRSPFREDPSDGTCTVRILLDYADLWRGLEKEVLDAVAGTIESFVAYLTDDQRLLLERSPREFLALNPRPEVAELVAFRKETVGGVERVVELTVAEPPKSPKHIRHIAIVPNLIPLERQLAALSKIVRATDDSVLAPLRVLLGLADASCLPAATADLEVAPASSDDTLDEFQWACVRNALSTPHFAVIKGPPGSGKTTVITSVIRRALARGERVLVVSPTHVAVDNVVEKLAPKRGSKIIDDLEDRSIPVRFAARPKKLLPIAETYWIGPKKQRRGAIVAQRLKQRLIESVPIAKALYELEDACIAGHAPLTEAVSSVHAVICGTPIGILSFGTVNAAESGSFGLLVVDEV